MSENVVIEDADTIVIEEQDFELETTDEGEEIGVEEDQEQPDEEEQPANRREAQLRTRLRDLDAAVGEVRGDLDEAAAAFVGAYAARYLAQAGDLWEIGGHDPVAFVGDDGAVDLDALQGAVRDLLAERPGLAGKSKLPPVEVKQEQAEGWLTRARREAVARRLGEAEVEPQDESKGPEWERLRIEADQASGGEQARRLRIKANGVELAHLEARRDALQAAHVVALAGSVLANGQDLLEVGKVEVESLLDAAGAVDPGKVRAAAEELVRSRRGLRKVTLPPVYPNFGQGSKLEVEFDSPRPNMIGKLQHALKHGPS